MSDEIEFKPAPNTFSEHQGPVVYAIGSLASKKLVIQYLPNPNKIEVDFETGTIKLEGSWDDNAKNFISMVEKMLRGGY